MRIFLEDIKIYGNQAGFSLTLYSWESYDSPGRQTSRQVGTKVYIVTSDIVEIVLLCIQYEYIQGSPARGTHAKL